MPFPDRLYLLVAFVPHIIDNLCQLFGLFSYLQQNRTCVVHGGVVKLSLMLLIHSDIVHIESRLRIYIYT